MKPLIQTKIISLWGGPSTAKSSTAAGVFERIKSYHLSSELVTEYVKKWAWSSTPIEKLDQPLIFGKQSHNEKIYFGKVEYLVTCSPILLVAFYDQLMGGKPYMLPMIQEFINLAEEKYGVIYKHLFLERHNKVEFQAEGRFQKQRAEAEVMDNLIKEFLSKNNIHYESVLYDGNSYIDPVMQLVFPKNK